MVTLGSESYPTADRSNVHCWALSESTQKSARRFVCQRFGFSVLGFGCMVLGVGLERSGVGCRVKVLGFGVYGSGCR